MNSSSLHRDHNDLGSRSLVMTQQSNVTSCLLLKHVAAASSNQAATQSAWSPLSLEIKQKHVELDYTPGVLLCPSLSDDGDGCAWIFTAPDVNILACQSWTSPVPTPKSYMVKWWSWLCHATVTHLLSPPTPHFVYELVNEQIAAW